MNRIWLFGPDIDTDQIIPGRYSPYMTSEDALAEYAFIERRPDFAPNVRPGDVIVAGKNFGCGSSREYAPRALQKCGIAGIIAPSFARIFFRNAINLGIPLFEADLTEQVADGDAAALDLAHSQLLTAQGAIDLPRLPQFVQQIQAEGGIVAFVQKYGRFPGEGDE
ncbi:MAG: homoaconitate hydratase [Anaerolineae bacterium]|nr:homoaconitate hydratase [Anaerolineae bacterium]